MSINLSHFVTPPCCQCYRFNGDAHDPYCPNNKEAIQGFIRKQSELVTRFFCGLREARNIVELSPELNLNNYCDADVAELNHRVLQLACLLDATLGDSSCALVETKAERELVRSNKLLADIAHAIDTLDNRTCEDDWERFGGQFAWNCLLMLRSNIPD